MSTRFGSWDEKTTNAQAHALRSGLDRLKKEAKSRGDAARYFRESARQYDLFDAEARAKALENAAFAVKQRQVIVGRIKRILRRAASGKKKS